MMYRLKIGIIILVITFGLGGMPLAIRAEELPKPAIQQKFIDFYGQGLEKFKGKNYQEAVGKFTKAIEANPTGELAYYFRGISRSYLTDNQGAIQDFDRVLEINPSFSLVYYFRGLAYIETGNKKPAISDLQNAANFYKQQGDIETYTAIMEKIKSLQ